MPYYEDPLDDPNARECDILEWEKDIEDPDDTPLPNIERSLRLNFNQKPIFEQLKPEPAVNKEELNPPSDSCNPEIDFFDEKNNSFDGYNANIKSGS